MHQHPPATGRQRFANHYPLACLRRTDLWVVDALITQGIALARLRKPDRAQYVLQQAMKIALEADALKRAGMAALTMIEEVESLSPTTLQAAYQQAREWLSDAQSSEVLLRLNDAAGKLAISLRGESEQGSGD